MAKMMITNKDKQEIAKKIFYDRVKDLHGHLLTASLPGTLLCATILFLGLYSSENYHFILSWYLAAIGLSVLRLFLLKWYERDSERINLHLKLFTFTTVLSGMIWGAAGTMLMSNYNTLPSVLIIIVIAGVTAGACQSLKASKITNSLFMLVSILPLALWLLMQKEAIYMYIGVAMLGYLAFMLIIAHKTYTQLVNMLQLGYENEILLKELASKHFLLEKTKEKLDYLVTHDFLTGTNNRHSLDDKFNTILSDSKKHNYEFCVMYLDVDHFKTINDQFGHETGDLLLVEVSNQLKKNLREQDVLVRMGGDEFVIMMADKNIKIQVDQFSRRIFEKLSTPITLNGHTILISISMGCCFFPEDGKQMNILLNKADHALYLAKKRGKNRCEFYKEEVSTVG